MVDIRLLSLSDHSTVPLPSCSLHGWWLPGTGRQGGHAVQRGCSCLGGGCRRRPGQVSRRWPSPRSPFLPSCPSLVRGPLSFSSQNRPHPACATVLYRLDRIGAPSGRVPSRSTSVPLLPRAPVAHHHGQLDHNHKLSPVLALLGVFIGTHLCVCLV